MYVVRWQLQTRFGHLKEVLNVLRQWEIDVGQRVGWKASSIRVLQGMLGASQSTVELETRADNLSDLESSWKDMEKSPHHQEAMKSLERFVVGDTWSVYQVVELFEAD